MINNIKELLPIGSVIRLRGAKRHLMVFGVCQTSKETQKTFDYIGVIWPEGNLGDKTQILFNHADVEEVMFTGMDNETRQNFIDKLSAYYELHK